MSGFFYKFEIENGLFFFPGRLLPVEGLSFNAIDLNADFQ